MIGYLEIRPTYSKCLNRWAKLHGFSLTWNLMRALEQDYQSLSKFGRSDNHRSNQFKWNSTISKSDTEYPDCNKLYNIHMNVA